MKCSMFFIGLFNDTLSGSHQAITCRHTFILDFQLYSQRWRSNVELLNSEPVDQLSDLGRDH